jgi:hypothetical protein
MRAGRMVIWLDEETETKRPGYRRRPCDAKPSNFAGTVWRGLVADR